MAWHQGETGGVADPPAAYVDKFSAMLDCQKTYGIIDESTVVLIGGVAERGPDQVAFNAMLLDLAASIPNAAYISPTGLPVNADGVHFTGAGLCKFAMRYMEKARLMLGG